MAEQIAEPALQDLMHDAVLAGEWVLDSSRSTVTLKNRSMGGLATVKGAFRQVTGSGSVTPAGEVTGLLTVAAGSLGTKNARRDKHLRSADFFDADNFPDITFAVESVRPSESDGASVAGTLSVRGRARPMTFEATVAVPADGEVWLDAKVGINRADFGLTWNFMGTVAMSNTLTIHAVFTRR